MCTSFMQFSPSCTATLCPKLFKRKRKNRTRGVTKTVLLNQLWEPMILLCPCDLKLIDVQLLNPWLAAPRGTETHAYGREINSIPASTKKISLLRMDCEKKNR